LLILTVNEHCTFWAMYYSTFACRQNTSFDSCAWSHPTSWDCILTKKLGLTFFSSIAGK